MTQPTDATPRVPMPATGSSLSPLEDTAPLVSIIVPTYCEAENLPILVPEVAAALDRSGMTAEILIVDDNSPDDTIAVCEKLSQSYPVKLLTRLTDRGLSSAVVHGLEHATGSVLLVMDADLSHPPQKVPEMVAAVLEQQGEFVIGSRYVPGGTTDDDWSLFRWLNSQVATWMSRGLTAAKDPMAGFFALSRQTFEQAEQLNPIGYKIGLELIVKCNCQRVAEVPIHFKDRLHGESKLSFKEQLNYLRHLGRLYRHKLGRWATPLLFGLVGMSGVVIDLIVFTLLLAVASFPVARAIAIGGAMTWNFVWNRNITFADRQRSHVLIEYIKFCSSCLVGALISWSLSTLVWHQLSSVLPSPQLAAIVGIIGGFGFNYLLSNTFVFKKKEPDLSTFLGISEPPSVLAHEPESTTVDSTDIRRGETAVPTNPVRGNSEQQSPGGGDIPRFTGQLESSKHLSASSTEPSKQVSVRLRWACGFAALLLALGVTSPSWFRGQIDGLDQAHNVLTSLFFYDLLTDMPVDQVKSYTFDYQRQYPALGLLYWPPLFHFCAGGLMHLIGPGLLAVQVTLTAFVVLFAVSYYTLSSTTIHPLAAVLAAVLTLTTPVVFGLSNTLMLELPSLAIVFATLWLYGRVMRRGRWSGAFEAVLAGGLCAGIAYMKQPAVFILLGILLDVIVSHRAMLRQSLTWLCVTVAAVMLGPLAVFTWKFGKINLAQSFGDAGNVYVEHHRVASRWSWDGWVYYLNLLPTQVPWLILVCAGIGLTGIMLSRTAQKQHGIWLWGFVAWFLMFSYFDNKQVRFVVYAIPFVSYAAVLFADWLIRKQRTAGAVTFGILAVLAVNNTLLLGDQSPRGFSQMKSILVDCIQDEHPGNFAYFGHDHHLFTAQLRLVDTNRQRSLIRGDDLYAATDNSLAQSLTDFRIRWLIVDPELPIGVQTLERIAETPGNFQLVVPRVEFDNGEKSFCTVTYKYLGPIAQTQRLIPLSSKMLGVSE